MASKYVTKEELIEEIRKFKKTCKYDENGKYIMGSGQMSERLGKMVWLIAEGVSRSSWFSGYTKEWKEDMIGDGVEAVCRYLHNYDPDRGSSPFAYISRICFTTFQQYLKKAKNHSNIKQKLYDNQHLLDDEFVDKAINYEWLNDFDK